MSSGIDRVEVKVNNTSPTDSSSRLAAEAYSQKSTTLDAQRGTAATPATADAGSNMLLPYAIVGDTGSLGAHVSTSDTTNSQGSRIETITENYSHPVDGVTASRDVSIYNKDGSYLSVTTAATPKGPRITDVSQATNNLNSIETSYDPKTGKPTMTTIGRDGLADYVEFDPVTGRPASDLINLPPNSKYTSASVSFDPATGRPSQVTLNSGVDDKEHFSIDPKTGKATAEPFFEFEANVSNMATHLIKALGL